jgi:hypothetical protein
LTEITILKAAMEDNMLIGEISQGTKLTSMEEKIIF